MTTPTPNPQTTPPSTPIGALSVVLIAPDAEHRRTFVRFLTGLAVHITRECDVYPNSEVLQELLDLKSDVFIIDLNANTEQALSLIESICSREDSATVMACASGPENGLLLRSMRAGAREFLGDPVTPDTLSEALIRALVRLEKRKPQKQPAKMLIFVGSKGGAGATMIATNFAVALAAENAGKVVVVDLDIQLGEIALNLGLTPKFSILDALKNIDRLDSVFLLGLLAKHTSGLSVLAAPEEFTSSHGLLAGMEHLLEILREEFAFVVVDAGPIPGIEDILFDMSDAIYIVTEASIPALRNSRRILTFIAGRDGGARTDVVLNRFNSQSVDIDEDSVAKALARPVSWRIPNDFAAVRNAENTGIPVAMKDSPVTNVLRQMTRVACGKPPAAKKKGRSLFGLFQS